MSQQNEKMSIFPTKRAIGNVFCFLCSCQMGHVSLTSLCLIALWDKNNFRYKCWQLLQHPLKWTLKHKICGNFLYILWLVSRRLQLRPFLVWDIGFIFQFCYSSWYMCLPQYLSLLLMRPIINWFYNNKNLFIYKRSLILQIPLRAYFLPIITH